MIYVLNNKRPAPGASKTKILILDNGASVAKKKKLLQSARLKIDKLN
jgi:hypothetical protein